MTHIFPIFSPRRDDLQRYLAEKGIETQVHYPIQPHRQRCYDGQWSMANGLLNLPITEQISATELSIPCHQAMTDEEVDTVIEALNSYLG